ncbi:hypothetical protein K1719_010910 [Acacia pycnantha]|nr:hypothetical protein K1719_010910 [Acacia pycnantha]
MMPTLSTFVFGFLFICFMIKWKIPVIFGFKLCLPPQIILCFSPLPSWILSLSLLSTWQHIIGYISSFFCAKRIYLNTLAGRIHDGTQVLGYVEEEVGPGGGASFGHVKKEGESTWHGRMTCGVTNAFPLEARLPNLTLLLSRFMNPSFCAFLLYQFMLFNV